MVNGMMVLLAQAGSAAPAQQQQPGGMFNFGFMVIIFVLFYVMLIRPQRRREKERKAMINAVKSGDRVLLTGGLIGTISTVKEKTLTIKLAENVKVEAVRSAIAQVINDGEISED